MGVNPEKYNDVTPWQMLQKRMTWNQLGPLKNQRILDFGSGNGMTADYYAEHNWVIAVEPSHEMLENAFRDFDYKQLIGSVEKLQSLESESFDVVLCHNVLEYVEDRSRIMNEFCRLLKPDGVISILKHNRLGRVMQMVILLNNFEHAQALLDGESGKAEQYGMIDYYENGQLITWCPQLTIEKVYGLRTFWGLQQNQQIQEGMEWQEKMLEMEERASTMEDFKNVAFFHHVFLRKKRVSILE
ncbi:MAG TPA: methyltransferase domain-containing protein [Candidatus Pelethocola excrementipullorum]|nr:methyltransferase domain-containing protein [Candidatus Pelethocola excrementipullorum]